MIKLTPSHTLVEPYEWGSNPAVEYLFTVERQKAWDIEYYLLGIEYDEESKTLYLPRGMNVQLLERMFKEKVISDPKYDKYELIAEDVKIKYLPRNQTQKDTIKFIIGIGEFDYSSVYSQLGVYLMTAKGKTYVTIASMAYLRMRYCVIASYKNWLEQWNNRILEYTDIKKKEILLLTPGTMRRIYEDTLDPMNYKVFLATHKSIANFAKDFRWSAVDVVFSKLKIGYKIFDEAHLYFENLSKIDFHTHVMKTIYLTASPYRSDSRQNEIYQLYFEKIPYVEFFNKEEDCKTAYLSIHYNSHPSPMQITRCKGVFGLNIPEYLRYIFGNQKFWMIVYIVFHNIITRAKGKTLILFSVNEYIFVMKQWIEENFPEYIGKIGIFYGKTPDEEREAAKEKKIILANLQIAGTAMDVLELEINFLMAAIFKSKVFAQQTFGRTGREDKPGLNYLYIELVDEGFKFIKKYWTFKQSVFYKYATECNKILYRDYDIEVSYEKAKREREALTAKKLPVKQKEDKYAKLPFFIKEN